VLAPKVRVFTDEDPNLLGADELAMLLESVRVNEPYWYALAVTLAFTGLRWGEATALKWTDVDSAKGVIWVRRGNWQGQEVTTKTERIRSVPLTPQLADVLVAHRAWQESLPADTRRGEGRLILTGVQAGWIFPARTGGLHKGFNFGVILRRCLKSAGIERHVTVHGLRRTFNNLLRQVTSGEVVRSITGHSTVAMTEHYSHIGAGEKLAAAGRMIQLMQPSVSGGSSGGCPENKNADLS
jgi:integrase